MKKIKIYLRNKQIKIKKFFKANLKDIILTLAFLIIFINTLFINVHIAFYLLAIMLAIMAVY